MVSGGRPGREISLFAGVAAEHRALVPLHRDSRLEPGLELQFADPLAVPPGEVLGRGDPGLDRLFRQSVRDDRAGQADHGRIDGHLLRGPGLEPGDGEPLGVHEPAGEVGTERFPERLVFGGGDAVGEAEVRRAVDADHPGVSLADEFGHPGPLVGLGLRVPGARNAPDVVARHREALHAFLRAAVVEHQHRPPPRRQPGVGEHGADDRVLVVLPRRDDPQVHALTPHDLGQDGLETDLQPAVHERGPLAQGQHGRGRLARREHRENESRQQGGNDRIPGRAHAKTPLSVPAGGAGEVRQHTDRLARSPFADSDHRPENGVPEDTSWQGT